MSVKFRNFVEVSLVSFQQITLKLGNFTNLKALFPAESIDFSSPAHTKKLKKTWKGVLSACSYRHMDDSQGRAYELQQAAVKCMRGILFCYMRQADKVSV